MSGFKFGMEIVIALILAVIVFKFQLDFVLAGNIQAGGGTIPPTEQIKCKVRSDCPDIELCLSINHQPNFCGCLDNNDCLSGKCISKKCST
jgi:hypothetical protein